jgi:hypothetical protein
MALTEAQRRSLRRKAADGSLEVEHLLPVAVRGDASDAPLLRALKAEFKWPDTGRQGRAWIVPLGRWTDTVCRFLEDGYTGVVRMAGESAGAVEFCASLLEEVKTPESVTALLAIGGPVVKRPEADVRLAFRLADAFNVLLSFKDRPAVGAAVEKRVRDFLHRLFALPLGETRQAIVVCALRGVGDAKSVSLIKGLPPFRDWAHTGLQQSAVRQIQQRTRPPAEQSSARNQRAVTSSGSSRPSPRRPWRTR